mgnify:CR=1 FL=1
MIILHLQWRSCCNMDVHSNNNALAKLNNRIGGLLHLGPNVNTLRTSLNLGPNVITFRT